MARQYASIRRAMGCAGLAAALFLSCCAVANGATRVAAESRAGPPTEPIARIDGTMHSALIKKLDVAADGSRALTASDDKTAKVWDLTDPTNTTRPRLLRTLRIPIADGYEGQLYTGALSPNGALAALGGFTGVNWDGGASVYFMNTTTGRMEGRLFGLPGGVPAVVENLKFSRDSTLIAVCLNVQDGRKFILQIFEVALVPKGADPARIAQDTELGGRILGIDFAENGDLTVASMDGYVHRYRARDRYSTPQRTKIGDSLEPMHVRYAPNGSSIAIGMNAAPRIALLDAQTLQIKQWLAPPADAHQQALHAVEWSPDGRYVFAAGEPQGTSLSSIFRWDLQGAGQSTPDHSWQVASRRVTDLYRVPPDGLLFSSADPSVGLLSLGSGEVQWTVHAAAPDLRHPADLFRASADGREVQFSYTVNGNQLVRFSTRQLDENALRALESPSADLPPARRDAKNLHFEYESSTRTLQLNGSLVKLEDKEDVFSHVVSDNPDVAYVGTLWAIRKFTPNGHQLWRRSVSSPVYQLISAAKGRYVIAGLGDGTVRWYRSSDGGEVAALYVQPPTKQGARGEWILWTPEGRYAASPQGDDLIGWHINRGANHEARFYRAVQFERVLYDPGAARRAFDTAGGTRLAHGAFSVRDLLTIAPPEILISSIQRSAGSNEVASFDVTANTDTLDMRSITAYVNDIPVTPGAAREVASPEHSQLQRHFELPLRDESNAIRIEVSNGRAIGVAEAWAPGSRRVPAKRGTLYVLAIGVGKFDDGAIPPLTYAEKDAEKLAAALEDVGKSLFAHVVTRVLPEAGKTPTAQAVIDALPFLTKAGPDDSVVLFLAGHALTSPAGDYYFLPSNTKSAEVRNLLSNRPGPVGSLVSWNAVFDALSRAAGERLLIVDTCHSADIRGITQTFSLAKRSAASRFAMIAASKGDELSQDYPRGKQGLFTYSLLTALSDRESLSPDGILSLAGAYAYLTPMVNRLRPLQTMAQTPQLVAPESLARMVLREAPPPRN